MLTKEQIKRQLSLFCKSENSPVIVHTSLKSIGDIAGGGETFLSALIEYFAENGGLLCIPTHTWITMKLDLEHPESCLGVLPTLAVQDVRGKRSLHPTHSMVVFGDEKRVDEFLKNEQFTDTPTGPDSCYGNIYRENGYVLLVGVDQTKNTFIHCVEEMLGVKNRLTEEKIESEIIHQDGSIEKRYLYWFDESKTGDVSLNFGKFEKAFRYHNCIEDGVVGNAPAQFCSAVKMKNVLEMIYKKAEGRELLSDNLP